MMFESKKELKNRVQPIKFRTIGEDDASQKVPDSHKCLFGSAGCNVDDKQQDDSLRRRRRHMPAPNFTLEYAYPAVTLENVCFSVDKSQQQANFVKEVLFRLSNCLNPILRGHNGDDERSVRILKSVNLNVPYGSIFGLLGPSSCGKTTLLRCLVGLLKPSSGSIRLFGGHLSTADGLDRCRAQGPCLNCLRRCSSSSDRSRRTSCKVPGANVGYMPQDLGLYEDFTTEQLLTMFGRYMRMESKLIKSRIAFMANFLELPDVRRQIQTLSGGQKRRVSFAIACLHMPPLIILDEPTVGVDPLLRQSIWKYLRYLASEENKTIIITTHYIEEAAQADQVALMRAGEILIQDTPARIMKSHHSKSLEEAFLKICNNVQDKEAPEEDKVASTVHKLFPQPKFNWKRLEQSPVTLSPHQSNTNVNANAIPLAGYQVRQPQERLDSETVMNEPKLKTEQKPTLRDRLSCGRSDPVQMGDHLHRESFNDSSELADNSLHMLLAGACLASRQPQTLNQSQNFQQHQAAGGLPTSETRGGCAIFRKNKFTINNGYNGFPRDHLEQAYPASQPCASSDHLSCGARLTDRLAGAITLFWALLYKNYRRNVNSIPLLVFQFMLPMIQMISFSLCVGGRPTNVGLGIVNLDQPLSFGGSSSPATDDHLGASLVNETTSHLELNDTLSLKYLSFVDRDMLNMQPYNSLQSALADVRKAKLWAVLEIGENFTWAISQRFDLENFYQLELDTISQSVIKIYPDRSNKILDMICHRSLVDSYRKFLSSEFEHFKRLPIEVARPIFDIKPNVISNSIDGYTESIAPGLLASLTYIMAAGLTTFIIVVERSAGILERTYTSGINPFAYLLAHAIFRSLVMMVQIAAVLVLTFYVLRQPLVGSIWLAYLQLMVLNMTGIAYGLLISSIVTDQNGAALTIVSSLVVKITLSGILWPFEAIPRWLRAICYVQPLTMPVQALRAITLKGAVLGDRPVNLGLLVSLTWLVVFLTISTKRFKFYQH